MNKSRFIIFKELTRIRQSTTTTWGIVPPRQGEADYADGKLREPSNGRFRGEKCNGLRQSESIVNENDGECTLSLRHSDPGPSPRHTKQSDSKRKRKLSKKSIKQLGREHKKTKEILIKFNESFPSDKVGVMQIGTISLVADAQQKTENNPKVHHIKVNSVLIELEDQVDKIGSSLGQASILNFPRSQQHRKQPATTTHAIPEPVTLNNTETEQKVCRSKEPSTRRKEGVCKNDIEKDTADEPPKENKENVQLSFTEHIFDQTVPNISIDTVPNISIDPVPNISSDTVPAAPQFIEAETNLLESNSRTVSPVRSPRKSPHLPIANVDVTEARDNISRRLANDSHVISVEKERDHASSPRGPRTLSPIQEQKTQLTLVTSVTKEVSQKPSKKQKTKKKKSDDQESDIPKFDSYRYNPDGSVRTMHQLPDFLESLKEAQKARYLRQKDKQWYEKELTVRDIFENSEYL